MNILRYVRTLALVLIMLTLVFLSTATYYIVFLRRSSIPIATPTTTLLQTITSITIPITTPSISTSTTTSIPITTSQITSIPLTLETTSIATTITESSTTSPTTQTISIPEVSTSITLVTPTTQATQVVPQPRIVFLKVPVEVVPRYGLVEIAFNISGLSYRNPFNTSDIDVWVYVETPSGLTVAVPAFYFQNYSIYRPTRWEEVVTRVGNPFWLARYIPLEEGVHRFYVKVIDSKGNTVVSDVKEFVVEGVRGRGFVRIDNSMRLFVFDSRESMFMLGVNIAWPQDKKTSISFYEQWFEKLSRSGIKVVRIGLVPWALTLEWTKLYNYNLFDAARIDEIVKLAEKYDIYIVFVFIWHNELADKWGDNPYNVKRGGILRNPEEFWSNPVAIKIFKDKVRYIIGRWGYSTHILAWELINEADLTTNFFNARDSFVNWVKEVSSYIKSIDPYKRIVTVNLADYNSEPRIWGIDTIDIVTVHRYGPEGFKDIAGSIPRIVEELWSRYRKPVIVTEFGVDYRWVGYSGFIGIPLWILDKEGVGLHEGLWSSIFSLSPVSAMSWWWDTQIDLYNLWYHYKALYRFLLGIDPVRGGLGKANVTLVVTETKPASIILYPVAGWIWSTPVKENRIIVKPDGVVEGRLDLLSGFIYGTCHSQRVLNPIITATFIDRGRVVIHVNSVGRGSAKISIYLNNTLVKEVALPDRDGKSDGSANEYNIDVEIELQPGVYEIRIDNNGCDWFTWGYIVLENTIYRSAKIDLYALANKTFAMLWIRNKDYNWWNIVVLNRSIEPAENIEIEIKNLQDGLYRVEFWDTYKGTIIRILEVQIVNGVARIGIDIVEKDIAIKIMKIK